MLAEWYAFPLLLWSAAHVFAINHSLRAEDSALPQVLVKNTSQLSVGSTSTSISFHPTSAFNAAPSPSSFHPTTSTHLPINPSSPHSTPIGHLSASISTHAPVVQRPSSPISHHPPPPEPIPSHSTSHDPNSSDTGQHSPPFHQHPPANPNNTHSNSSGPSVAQIFFEALGGVIGLVVVLAAARCFYVYRRTPTSRRPPTPDIGEVERTMALLRPGRILERAIPPPPYQPAPDYDSIVVGTESTSTHPSVGTNATTSPSTSCITPTPTIVTQPRTRSLSNLVSISVSAPTSMTTTSSSISHPPSRESIPPTSTNRPPDVQVSV